MLEDLEKQFLQPLGEGKKYISCSEQLSGKNPAKRTPKEKFSKIGKKLSHAALL